MADSPHEKINILAVDDRPENLLALESLLDSPELHVVKAESGNEALRLVLLHTYALVLLDVQMPGMDGFETAELLRLNPKTKDIPIIFLTAISREQSYVFRGYETGAVDYITKPIEPLILQSKVAVFCELYRQRLAIENSYARLRELEENRDALVHMVVHDLRTPLWGIHGYLDMLTEIESDMSPEGLELVQQMSADSATLLEMVSSILDVSKMEARGMDLNVTSFDVEQVVRRLFRKLAPLSRDREMVLENAVSALVIMEGDEGIVSRVIENLLSNAIKYTPEFGGRVCVCVDANDEQVTLTVQDNGSGIPAECVPRVFEKFGQVEDRKNYRKYSTGLGLPFCKMAVEAHGGTISLDSEEGKGSRFRVLLPLRQR